MPDAEAETHKLTGSMEAVLHRGADSLVRLAGDKYVFMEFGDMVLDFGVRAKVAEVRHMKFCQMKTFVLLMLSLFFLDLPT